DAQDGNPCARLRVADLGPAADVFGVSAFGNVIGNNGVLGALSGFEYSRYNCLFVRRKLKVGDRLTSAKVEGLSWIVVFALLFVLFAFLCTAFADFEQVPLFLLYIFLAFSSFLLFALFGARLLAASSEPAATGRRRRLSWSAPDSHISQLHERACIERHHEQIVRSSEIDSSLIASKVSAGFDIGGAGDLPPLARGVVVDKHIAVACEQSPFLVA